MTYIADKITKVLINLRDEYDIEDIIHSIRLFSDAISQTKIFNIIINTPGISLNKKIDIITKISQLDKRKSANIVLNLMVILLKMKKLYLAEEILKRIKSHILKSKGFTDTWVAFASAPTQEQIKLVESILVQKYDLKPKINVKVHAPVVAGFLAFFDGKMLDASLHNSFDRLAKLHV
ncbi:MAG: F0F1 ATP synthase subunit delta [Rickettsiaceae bacterium]|nr:F0F1 ATP synthase subunit delta [Rickettsiaceae bacterium]